MFCLSFFMVPACVLDYPFSSGALEQFGEFKLQFDIGLVPFLGSTWQLGLDFGLGQFRNLGKRISPAPDESQSSSNREIHVDDQGLS
jgi:hypothetical protein